MARLNPYRDWLISTAVHQALPKKLNLPIPIATGQGRFNLYFSYLSSSFPTMSLHCSCECAFAVYIYRRDLSFQLEERGYIVPISSVVSLGVLLGTSGASADRGDEPGPLFPFIF
jgi:hypothetical protein